MQGHTHTHLSLKKKQAVSISKSTDFVMMGARESDSHSHTNAQTLSYTLIVQRSETRLAGMWPEACELVATGLILKKTETTELRHERQSNTTGSIVIGYKAYSMQITAYDITKTQYVDMVNMEH